MELKINEVDVQKLNLQPGEVLVVKVKSDQVSADDIQSLCEGLKEFFPNNKVVVLAVEEGGDINLTTIKDSCNIDTNCCGECNCKTKMEE